ncbi:MAG: hypothetical protein GY724_18305 [Actinomycetia bacterium]|nr:hypothetical protein [Actinomycetes bacterium]MCP4223846.1 hypothetical protein [Actinomycetes bacterium]MCP5032777.1 hypothetical protein [Actinomycetes bacterium]
MTGLVMMGGGLILAIGLVVLGITSFPDVGAFPRASGENQPVVLTAGDWTVFAEGGGSARPRQITSPDGEPVFVGHLSSSQTYTSGSRSGVGVGTIKAPVDGTYLVTTEPGATVAFGQSFGSDLLMSILAFLGAAFGGGGLLIVGLILAVVAATRRRR